MFQNKVVIITGAASGIGAGTAVAFAKEGAKLVLGDRNEENMKKTVRACEDQGRKAEEILTVIGDITSEDICNETVDKAVDKYGQVDVVVNNAGLPAVGDIKTTTIQDMDAMYNIHVRAPFMLIKCAIPYLEKTKGSIINVSSIAAGTSPRGYLAYSTAKAALSHFTKCLAQGVAASGVRVNGIMPGGIDTPIISAPGGPIEGHPEKHAEFLEELAGAHALNRCGTVDECANLIVFLASEKASFITGAIVPVDGGFIGKGAI